MIEALPRLLLLTHLAATVYMVGVIWFVQVVHYPLFAAIASDKFTAYEQRHASLTTWVVFPPMLVEAATVVLMFWFRPDGLSVWQLWTGMALLTGIWISTFLVQVPCHRELSKGFSAAVHYRLVLTNWIRTVGWSLRGLLVSWMAWDTWNLK